MPNTAVRKIVVALALAMSLPTMANATVVDFRWSGAAGYNATGSFTFNDATAPTAFSDSGMGALRNVQAFSITFTDPANTTLESGASVIDGVSSDRFFRLDYDTATRTITSLDADIGGTYIYFLTNLRTLDGQRVGPGLTGFNFFDRRTADAGLDSAPLITASVTGVIPPSNVPAPSVLVPMGVAALGLLRRRRA